MSQLFFALLYCRRHELWEVSSRRRSGSVNRRSFHAKVGASVAVVVCCDEAAAAVVVVQHFQIHQDNRLAHTWIA